VENQTAAATPATEKAKEILPRWNLSELYSGPDDPKIEEDLESAAKNSRKLNRFRGKLHKSENLIVALVCDEEIGEIVNRVSAYADLACQINLNDDMLSALRERIDGKVQAIVNDTRFLELEIGDMKEKAFQRLMRNPSLQRFAHYLQRIRAKHCHRLSEQEENLAADKDLSGENVLEALFQNEFAGPDFQLELPEPRMATEEEVMHCLRHPDRATRADAAKGLTAGLENKKRRLGIIFQGVLRDCEVEDRHRGYATPEAARNLHNELRDETVKTMIQTVVGNYEIVADYFRLKRRLLGLPDFYEWDRYAPLRLESSPITFGEAKRLVSETFADFDPGFGEICQDAWGWLDAEPRSGKYGGGFCANIAPGIHPYVLVNFRGKVEDITTIAHEFGHAVHEVLAGERAKLSGNLNDYHAPISLAEIASIFMELLAFDRLLRELPKETRLAMLLQNIDGMIATVFRQATMHRFEAETHRLLRTSGSITSDEAGEIWQRLQQEMHGDSVQFTEGHKLWWMYIPHFFESPFYVYSYSFGQLLAIALYGRYKAEGRSFVPTYKHILAAGGSRSPYDLLAPLGINLDDPAFWQSGLDSIRGLVTETASLARELGLLKTE
jgi:oligoendopeptidase F